MIMTAVTKNTRKSCLTRSTFRPGARRIWKIAGLLPKVWVDIMLYFIRRGRENLRVMSKDTFVVGIDAS